MHFDFGPLIATNGAYICWSMNGNAEAGQKRKVEDTLWNSLADVCSDLTDSQSFQIRDKSSGSSGGLIDLSGSMLERKKYDFFDLDENDYIVLQPKIPIFPEDFPANKKEWPLSWWGIVDPKLLGEPPKKRKGKSNKSEKSATSNHGSRSRDKYQDAPPHDRYERRSEERFRRGPPPPPRAELDRPGPPSDYRGPPPNFQGPRDKGPYPNDYQFDDERRRRPHDRVPPPRYRDDRRPQRYSHDRESPPPRWERGPPKNFDEDRNLPPRQMDDRGPPRPLDRSPPRYQDGQRDDMGPPHYPGDRHHHHHHPPDDFQFRHHDDRGRNNGGNRGRGDWRQDDRGRNDRDDRKGRRPRRPDDRESRYR